MSSAGGFFLQDKRAAGWQVFMQNVQRGAQKLKPSPFISIVKHSAKSANGSIESSILAHKIKTVSYPWGPGPKSSKPAIPSGRSAEFSLSRVTSVLLWLAARVSQQRLCSLVGCERREGIKRNSHQLTSSQVGAADQHHKREDGRAAASH